jgi:hypothetical protein
LNGDPVSDFDTVRGDGLCERGSVAANQCVIAGNVDLTFGQVTTKTVDVT